MTETRPDELAYEIDGQLVTSEQAEQMRLDKLQGIRSEFVTMRDKWVAYRARSGVEQRWRKNAQMFLGEEDDTSRGMEDTLRNGPAPRGVKMARSSVVLNITRSKVNQAIARLCEILLPVDDKNWGIKPTPVPDSVQKYLGDETPTMGASGMPTGMTSDQEAQTVIKQAEDAAEAMSKEIDDALTECNFNGEERKMITEGVKLGTGVILGPFPGIKRKKSWQPLPGGMSAMIVEEETVPQSKWASCWDVWFDPACGNDHQRGRGFFERRRVTRKEIRALVGEPGYIESALKKVLVAQPKRLRVADNNVTREDADDDSYELWMYFGDIEPDQMEMLSEEGGDPVTDVSCGMLVMINDEIVGVAPSWISDNSLPCDVWCWQSADDSPYGYGLPDELDHQQRVVNSAWRMVMDNGRYALAPQIVVNRKKIVPQTGSTYDLSPGKIWLANDDVDDVKDAFASFAFPSHLTELLAIVDAALKFADQETNMPQMLGGERGTAPETVGGMVMLQSNALAVPRLRVKLFDDKVTRPHIGRHYDYFMSTSPKQEIKGDMEVDARGVSVLLERDIQNQAAVQLANVTSNPRYQGLIDPKKELAVILPAFKVKPEDILYTDEEIKQMQEAAANQPPQDPRIAVAQMNMQTKQAELAADKEQREVEMQLAQMDMQTKQQNTAYQIERERSEAQQAQTDRQFDREIAIAKMQQDGQLDAAELASKERLEMLNLTNDRELFNAEAALRVNTGAGI